MADHRQHIQHAIEATHLVIRERAGMQPVARGCGFWISDNLFLTSYHVLMGFVKTGNVHQDGDSYCFLRRTASGMLFTERVSDFQLWLNAETDLALFKVNDDKRRAHLKTSASAYPGQDVALIGYPYNQLQFSSRGVNAAGVLARVKKTTVSACYTMSYDAGEARHDVSQKVHAPIVEIDCALPDGFCGSPILDLESGEVVGIAAGAIHHALGSEYVPTEERLIEQGAPTFHVQAWHDHRSHGIDLRAFKPGAIQWPWPNLPACREVIQ